MVVIPIGKSGAVSDSAGRAVRLKNMRRQHGVAIGIQHAMVDLLQQQQRRRPFTKPGANHHGVNKIPHYRLQGRVGPVSHRRTYVEVGRACVSGERNQERSEDNGIKAEARSAAQLRDCGVLRIQVER
ncbi:hypothetical protein D3C84_585210 [compost metagenome]